MAKLQLISKSQRFRLACSAVFVFLLLAQFVRSGSLVWGVVFVLGASFLYFRETANMLSALPLFAGSIITPFFFPHNLGTGIATLFAAVVAVLFGVALGAKNLVLIHREELLEASSYALSYAALLLFFMQALSLFFPAWLFAVYVLCLAFYALFADYRPALFCALVVGELMWIVSWLPIGFLNAASLCFAVTLFIGDAVRENRIRVRNSAIIIALIVLIVVTSHWRM